MPFIPDSIAGISYVSILGFLTLVALLGNARKVSNLVILMWVHWVSIRIIDVIDKDNSLLWIGQGTIMVILLLFTSKLIVAKAMAIIFYIGILCDEFNYFKGGSFDSAAAIGELIGYLAMIFMAGAAHDMGGRTIRIYRSIGARYFNWFTALEKGCTISPRSRMFGGNFSKNNNMAKADRVNHGR
jgi:hypothetical protein